MLISCFNSITQCRVEGLHFEHPVTDQCRCVKACHSQVVSTVTIHPGMLEHRVLLRPLGATPVIEPDKIGECHPAVEHLASDKDIERSA